jgi:predicted TPR repeat methyltransferase
MDARLSTCLAIAERCASGALSAQVALMEMLIATEDVGLVETALGMLAQRADAARHAELARVFADHREGCAKIAALLRAEQTPEGVRTVAESLAFSRALFDQLVRVSEETSVALYSLGSSEILAAASDEIVAQLTRRRLLSPLVRVLDMGVGIGRMAVALSPHVAHIEGIDISPQMVAAARRRCADLANVHIDTCSGSDFAGFAGGAFELVLAVDSFPYVVSAGETLVQAIFAEAARVLVPGGSLVILNFSYRDDLARDRAEAAALAEQHGFVPEALGELPFSLWNGALFALRRT